MRLVETPSVLDLEASAPKWLSTYCDPKSRYAWPWYDIDSTLGQITPLDLLAPSLLDYDLPHKIVRSMLQRNQSGGEYESLRERFELIVESSIGSRLTFDEIPAESLIGGNVEVWCHLVDTINFANKNCDKLTGVAVTKILHRKIPHLVPLIDSRVRTFYFGKNQGKDLELLRRIHEDINRPQVKTFLDQVRSIYRLPSGSPMSRLRALDIIVWMSSE